MCKELTNITIPKSATEIGSDAFWGCKKLSSITIPKGVTTIGKNAFVDCSDKLKIRTPAKSYAHECA